MPSRGTSHPIVTDFDPMMQITDAVTHNNEVRLQIDVPRGRDDPNFGGWWAKDLRDDFDRLMRRAKRSESPFEIVPNEADASRLTLIYKSDSKGARPEDFTMLVGILASSGIIVDAKIVGKLITAFEALSDRNLADRGGAANAELARRAGKEPGSSHSR